MDQPRHQRAERCAEQAQAEQGTPQVGCVPLVADEGPVGGQGLGVPGFGRVVERQVHLLGEDNDAERVRHARHSQHAPPALAMFAPSRSQCDRAPQRRAEEEGKEQHVPHIAVEGRLHRGISCAVHLQHGEVDVGTVGAEEAGHEAEPQHGQGVGCERRQRNRR